MVRRNLWTLMRIRWIIWWSMRQLIAVKEKILGGRHLDTLTSMHSLTLAYEAEEFQVPTVESWERMLGDEHPDKLTAMFNLALTYQAQCRWEEVEQLQVQAMESWKLVTGEEHPSTLTSMASLASTYWSQGRI
jgi:hypothetical protein